MLSPDALVQPFPIAEPLDPLWNDSTVDNSGIFGLPFLVEEASLVVVPVPWDFTCSQGNGTANAPRLISESSVYVELHDLVLGNIYERGIAMADESAELTRLVDEVSDLNADDFVKVSERYCEKMNQIVKTSIASELKAGRATGVIGGDHSVSYGSIAAHCDAFPEMGIVQIDAHADLRPALDGVKWSHASVMYHVMENLRPQSLTQIGIRGICSVERAYQTANANIRMFSDHELQLKLATGQGWLAVCDQIIATLPHDLYLTLDIDGLDPSLCPNTGTPVPGGLSFSQVVILLNRIVQSGRVIRGFDLVEVGGDSHDALIAAHLLYTLCGLVENRKNC